MNPSPATQSPANQLPTRDQVPVELTWNLDDIYPSPEAWDSDLAHVGEQIAEVERFVGRLGDGPDTLLAFLRARDALLERLLRLGAYARLASSVEATNPRNQAMSARADALAARIGAALAFFQPELIALPEGTIQRWLAATPELDTYRRQLEDLLLQKAHALSAETERALAALDEILDAPYTVWQRATGADAQFPPVRDPAGRELPVTVARWVFGLAHSPNRDLRRQAYDSIAAGLDRYKNTLAQTLALHVARNVALARLRGYGSAVEMILSRQRLPVGVYRNVLDVVHDDMAPHYRRLVRLRQRLLGLDRVYRYDLEAPLDPDFDPPTTFDQAGRLIGAGLAPLGGEYAELVRAAFRDRWVDRADNQGKRSGAFCAAVYGVHSYVFTTWQDKLRNALILAHELGHAGHQMLAMRNQVVTNTANGFTYGSTLFFGEAPSTANEMLVGRHILDTADDPRLRRFVIMQFLGTYTHNMVTHMLEAHFEQRLYDLAEAGQPITTKTVLDTQGEVFARFYGDAVELRDQDRLYWIQQPHFYVNLYPYTYAAGLACAYNVVAAIRGEGEPAVRRWLDTLRAGTTRPPLDLMRMAGVDMSDPAPIRRAVAYFGELVDELERSFT